jgi:hypothetical protein
VRELALLRTDAEAAPARHIFLVEAVAAADTLARILGPFIVLEAELTSVDYRADSGVATIRIEVAGLAPGRETLTRHRLEGLPVVRRVGLGWR